MIPLQLSFINVELEIILASAIVTCVTLYMHKGDLR